MTPLPIPASVIPTGGPWGAATSATIDGTLLVVALAAVLVVTAAIGVAGALAHWRDLHVRHPRARHLTMRSA